MGKLREREGKIREQKRGNKEGKRGSGAKSMNRENENTRRTE